MLTIAQVHFIVSGVTVCLQYTLAAICFGCILGLLLACLRLSNKAWLQWLAKIYVSVFRGTPLLVQLSFVYYALPLLVECKISALSAGIITFSLNSAAYVAEIFRAGIQSVDKGQLEACQALHIPYFYALKDIILPQALHNIAPTLINECISLFKETAIISFIGEADIMRRANTVAAETYNYAWPLLVAAITYYCVISIISLLANKCLERLPCYK
jgi:polar amino acid transport system permease protein